MARAATNTCFRAPTPVFAQLVVGTQRHGVHAFLVPLRDEAGHARPGIRFGDSGHKLGLNGLDNGRIWFDRVRIPRENLLARFAQVSEDGTYVSQIPSSSRRFFAMLGTLVGGRIAVASGGLSAAKIALTIAVRYGVKRRQSVRRTGLRCRCSTTSPTSGGSFHSWLPATHLTLRCTIWHGSMARHRKAPTARKSKQRPPR